jgi:hypothetical protein
VEHLKVKSVKRNEKDKAIALALSKLAELSAATRQGMQSIAQAMLVLVAKP